MPSTTNTHSLKALKLTASDTPGSVVSITKNCDFNVNAFDTISFWCDVENAYRIDSIKLELGTDSSFSRSAHFTFAISDEQVNGPQALAQTLKYFSKAGGFISTDVVTALRITLTSTAGGGSVVLDSLHYARKTTPQIVISFDDGWISQYTEAFPYLQSRGIPGTIYTIDQYVGDPSYISLAQAQEMYAAGWDIANHGNLAWGMNRNHADGSETSVALNQTPTSAFNLNGDAAENGEIVLTEPRLVVLIISTSEQGKYVTITGENSGQVVSEDVWLGRGQRPVSTQTFDRITSMTISAPASGPIKATLAFTYSEAFDFINGTKNWLIQNNMPRGADFMAYPNGERNVLSDQAMIDAGIKLGRLITGQNVPVSFGLYSPYKINAKSPANTASAGDMLTDLNAAIELGVTVHLTFHRLVQTETNEIDLTITKFQEVIDWLKRKVDEGEVEALTVSDWYSRLPAKPGPEAIAIPASAAIYQKLRHTENLADTLVWDRAGATVAIENLEPATGIDGRVFAITDPGSGFNNLSQTVSISGNTGIWTLSVYMRKDTNQSRFPEMSVNFYGGVARQYRVQINTQTGSPTTRALGNLDDITVTDHDAEWWRVSISGQAGSDNTVVNAAIFPALTDTEGVAVSGTSGSVNLCGVMLQEDSVLASYQKRAT